jgi:hypothetical protein
VDVVATFADSKDMIVGFGTVMITKSSIYECRIDRQYVEVISDVAVVNIANYFVGKCCVPAIKVNG